MKSRSDPACQVADILSGRFHGKNCWKHRSIDCWHANTPEFIALFLTPVSFSSVLPCEFHIPKSPRLANPGIGAYESLCGRVDGLLQTLRSRSRCGISAWSFPGSGDGDARSSRVRKWRFGDEGVRYRVFPAIFCRLISGIANLIGEGLIEQQSPAWCPQNGFGTYSSFDALC